VDTIFIKKCMKEIQVKNLDNQDVEVINNSPLVMIGKGRQGAVFQYTDDICIKVFGNAEDCEREYYALSLGQQTDLFPRLYDKGKLYIAMEIIKGVDVREYLQSQPLTEELSLKLINMLITFKEIGYDRIDHHKRQIYLQPDGSLKVIDVARAVWRDRVYPYPRKLLTSLGEKNKKIFMTHVQQLKPELYNEWMYYIQMEEVSREIYQLLLDGKTDKLNLSEQSEKLLTTHDQKIHKSQLENMMHKVFKEEWVKTMLARGANPDKVMDKIDEYWKKLQLGMQPQRGNRLSDNGRGYGKSQKLNWEDYYKKTSEKDKKGKSSSKDSWGMANDSMRMKKRERKRRK